MIETYVTPAAFVMAAFACSIWIEFFIYYAGMNIFVAIEAIDSYIPELPPVTFFMTYKTWRSQMCTS